MSNSTTATTWTEANAYGTRFTDNIEIIEHYYSVLNRLAVRAIYSQRGYKAELSDTANQVIKLIERDNRRLNSNRRLCSELYDAVMELDETFFIDPETY
jgi:hypothetical protein